MFEMMTPQYFSDVSHPHRRTGVAGIGLLYGIDTEHTHGIGEGFGV
jgi:hypothetical protein